MGDHERRDVRRVLAGGPGRNGAMSSDGMQRQVMAGPNGSPMMNRTRSVGATSSTTKEASGNTFDPASPSPGQGKRPQQANQDTAPLRPVVKRQKVDRELSLHVLLPNGTALKFTTDTGHIHTTEDVIRLVEAHAEEQEPESSKSPPRTIEWGPQCWIEDCAGNKLNVDSLKRAISAAKTGGTLSIILQDGDPNSIHVDKNMWDVTPKPEMLGTLPQGYTLETALADQVDNALQAVWGNHKDDRRLVRVTLGRDTITVFDTGQGMDASPENCIANWGTVGGSNHRAVHHKALGGDPPYLKPYLGKYGAGGIAAALHLGSSVTVWSKTKASKRVASLILEQKTLLEKSKRTGDRVWKTGGGLRDMTEEEKALAPHGSFTRVEISKLKSQYCVGDKQQYWKVERIRQLLKDIYFPYIQMELSSSSKTVCLVEFQVNDLNLVEIWESETAILKMHTCPGDSFVFEIHMQRGMEERDRDEVRTTRQNLQVAEEANARVTCQYYPNKNGKESLETALQELKGLNPQNSLTFETMPRVNIRWLGRLLPEGKWPILPFMEVTSKKELKSGVRRPWAKRVRAFVDTDAGFHPNQSKTELERDQPFAVALKATGSRDFSGTSAEGVVVSFKHGGNQLSPSELIDAYMEWLKTMHSEYDEDFNFVDEPTYIVNQPNALDELGVDNAQVLLVFYKHIKDSRGDFKVDPHNPLRIKLPKGAHGLKFELFATVEFFFHDAAEEHGEVKFICRPLGVAESDGSKIVRKGDMPQFQLNKSLWFPAALLSTDKLLDEAKWKKRIEDLSNKSPSLVEILREDDIKNLEISQKIFPADKSILYAGYNLPKELFVVVRPKKGTGPSYKQGMIVSEPIHIFLTVTRCNCPSPCWKRGAASSLGRSSSPHAKEDHEVVYKMNAQNAVSQSGVKGLYVFSLGSSEVKRLTTKGIYTFHISAEGDKYKGVLPAVSSIQIVPSKHTAKWTICCHAEDCKYSDHSNETLGTAIKLNERLQEDLFIQKYDEFDNRQIFEKPLDLEVMVLSAKGKCLEMRSKIQANFVKANPGGKYRLQIKNLLFKSGIVGLLEPAYEGVLRASFPKEKFAEIKCRVLPGPLALIQVKDSRPSIPKGSMCFQEALKPGEIIKRLTLQGLDDFGNKIEKGQKVLVQLEGLEWQDNSADSRELDDHGCLQLGGLLKVSCHYNASGSISIISSGGKKLSPISFQTVTRQLHVTGVPCKSYVGRQLEGVTIEIADEFGNIDAEVDGHIHSLTVDWMKGVTCPFVRGQCILPDFRLPEKPGSWEGKVYFSANRSLSATISVQLELATACSLGPPRRKPAILKAQSGVPFTVPFSVFDDKHQSAVLTEAMKQTVDAKAEAKDPGDESRPIFRRHLVERKDIKQSRTADIQGYEAVVVISGSVGTYQITLMDTCFNLKGQVETTCNLEHGHIARLVPAQSDETQGQSLAKPLTLLEVKRCSLMPRLTVTLLDSADNLCVSSERRLLSMKVLDCPEWNVKSAEVIRGVAYFESFSLVVPVGSYQVSIELNSLPQDFYSLDEQLAPITAQFSLRVCHGNYPSALKLLSSTTVSVSLTEAAIQYLPPTTVFVESADGMRLQSRPTVGVRLHGDNSISSGPREYFGTFIETFEKPLEMEPSVMREDEFPPGEAGVGSLGPVRYDFSQVCVPSVAGTYVMEFFVPGSDLLSQSQHLIVRHGPPARLEIIQREPGQEMDVLQVNLVDGHGNTCEDIYSLEVALELALSKNFSGTPGLRQCDVYGKSTATVKRGKGDFGVFELRQGMPGMYTLKVFGIDSYTNSPSLTPAEAQIFIAQGNICDTIQQECAKSQTLAQDCYTCLRSITLGENVIQQKTAAKLLLEEHIRKIEADLRQKEGLRDNLRRVQEAEHDDEIIRAELAQPLRTEQVVIDDISHWARRGGNDFALAVLDAQTEGNFLSPQSPDPVARDILGPVVMLGRVESEALNRVLSEFLGPHSLLLIICRTQSGLSALEQYDERGKIDESKGLYGFARGRNYRLNGTYDVLTLKDIRPDERNSRLVVDNSHPQRLLKIDPPVFPSGQVPVGFLGYAVNFVHLRSEHLQIREISRQGQEVGLRETLFLHLLGLLQVYDTRQHMVSAKNGLRKFDGAVSLDGGNIKKNMRQKLGRLSDNIPQICFGTVPSEERRVLSLVPPACYAFERSMKMNLIREEIETQHESLVTLNGRLSTYVQELEHYKMLVETTKREQKQITEKNERTQAEISELMKMKNAIAAKNGSVETLGNSSCSYDSDSEKMRAFMM